MNLAKQLFKKDRPEFRPFEFPDYENGKPGDLPCLWEAYKQGRLNDLPDDFNLEEFTELAEAIRNEIFEVIMVEDKVGNEYQPVGVVFVKSLDPGHWQIEPHVTYFSNATPRIILRTYVAFLKKTKYRKDIGACVLRLNKETTRLANKVESLGFLEYVGKIWGGRPNGNDYLYSIRCNRRI